MSDRSLTITRTELGLGLLQLWAPGKYVILDDSSGPGTQTYRRSTAESPWVAGRFATAIVPDVQIASLAVQVQGTSEVNLLANMTEILAAFKQFSFTLTSVHHGLGTQAWLCERADYGVGASGQVSDFDLIFNEQVVTFSIPRSPINVIGVL